MRPDRDHAAPSPGANGLSEPPAAYAGPPPAGDRVRTVALAVLTAAALALCVALAVPLLPALTWGTALAVLVWPLHARVARRLGRPSLAALVSTAVVVALIVVPLTVVASRVAREAAGLAERFGDAAGGPREWLTRTPGLGWAARWADRAGIDLDAEGRKAAESAAQAAAGFAVDSVKGVAQALIAVVVLFFLLRDRREFAWGVRGLLPLSEAEADRVAHRAADAVHANLYANVVTSLIDAVGAGVVLWAVGVPAPVLWAMVTFVVTLLPLVGSSGVWVPAAVLLALAGRWLPAAVVVGWGVATWALVDHLLYVRLVGGRMRLHPLLLLVAILGGLALFGASGLVLGPAVLAVTDALVDAWRRQRVGTQSGATGEADVSSSAAPVGLV